MITHQYRTVLGEIPDSWGTTSLRAAVERSASGQWGDDSGEVAVDVLRSTNFTNTRRLDFSDVAKRWFASQRAQQFDIRARDVLLERSGGGPSQPVGRVVTAREDLPGFGFSNFVQLLRINPEEMDPDFVAWCLARMHQSGVIERLQHQTTQMRNLDFRDYMRVVLPKPPRDEQKAIAAALAAADAASIHVDRQIAAVDQLRRVLAQQLVLRGMPGLHSDLHDSPIGDIPRAWEVIRLGRLLERMDAGSSPQCESHSARPGHWGVLKVSAVSWDGFDESANKELPAALEPNLDAAVQPGDLVVSRANTTGLCGAAQIVGQLGSKLLLCDKTWRVVPKAAFDPRWLLLVLKSQPSRRQIEAFATGTSDSMKNISQRDFRRIWIAVPPEDERRSAVETATAVDRYRESLIHQRHHLARVQRSLLQHLLVGRARLADRIAA